MEFRNFVDYNFKFLRRYSSHHQFHPLLGHELVGSLMILSKELYKYMLGGTEPAGEYTFFYGKESENHELDIMF
jgi:hypothetical protein